MKRKLIILLATFALVLTAGVAAAQVGSPQGSPLALFGFGFDSNEPDTTVPEVPKEDQVEIESDDVAQFVDEAKPEAPDDDQQVDEKPNVVDEPIEDEVIVSDEETKTEDELPEPKDEDHDDLPPLLKITAPAEGSEVESEFIVFSGVTEPGATVHAGDWAADVAKNGEWAIKLRLNPGKNRAAFVATDAAGNTAEASISVTYVAPEPKEEPKEEPKDLEFTAHQKYEASDGEVPANKYYGTAPAGTEIAVASEYGSGSTKANDHGEWLVWVEFPNAPDGVHFDVVVESSNGDRKVFDMVAYHKVVVTEFSANQKLGSNADNWDRFWGTGQPGTKITASSEFGGASTEVGDHGEWELKVHFESEPGTTFAVTISDTSGHSKVFEFTNPEQAVIEFSANQKYGSCSEELPFDIFYGKAEPGSTIWVESPFGGGSTTAGDKGHWEIRVDFPDAPISETFEVVIESSDGGRKVLSFKAISA